MRSILWCVVSLTIAIAACGCGGDDPLRRYSVSGTATFDGQPLPEGDIVFLPTDGKARPEGGAIKNGAFTVDMVPGKKRVEIRASRENPGKLIDSMLEPGKKVPAREDYIPAKYNDKSELTADVTSSTPPLKFELKSN